MELDPWPRCKESNELWARARDAVHVAAMRRPVRCDGPLPASASTRADDGSLESELHPDRDQRAAIAPRLSSIRAIDEDLLRHRVPPQPRIRPRLLAGFAEELE